MDSLAKLFSAAFRDRRRSGVVKMGGVVLRAFNSVIQVAANDEQFGAKSRAKKTAFCPFGRQIAHSV